MISLFILAILGLSGAVFLFSKNQTLININQTLENERMSLGAQLESLKEEKSRVDTELAVLKNTDLAKEVELLEAKLGVAKSDLAKKERDLASANNRLKAVDANRGKINSHLDAIEAVSKNYWHYTLTEQILDGIEAKVKALGDSEIFSLWIVARKQTTPDSANPSAVWDVVGRMLTKVRSLLP